MNTKDASPDSIGRLERRDLIRFERRLRESIEPFLPHTGCTLHFPNDTEKREPEYLSAEKRLLLPLYAPQPESETAPELLGVLVARGVQAGSYEALSGYLPQIAAAAMENLLFYKAALSDAATGLFSRQHFLNRMATAVRNVSDYLRMDISSPAREIPDPDFSEDVGKSPCLAALVIRLHGLRQVVRKHGYMEAEDILGLVSASLRGICPERGAAARIGDYELAVLMPSATPGSCKRFAHTALEEFAKISLPVKIPRPHSGVNVSIGYALFPQDITGTALFKPDSEQARVLLRKARLAAALAAERAVSGGTEPVLAFGRIVAEGGRITGTPIMARVTVSLGSSVNARECQHFAVWASEGGKTGLNSGSGGTFKGEIVLIEVRENSSVAEIIHQADPASPILSGDSLTLLPGEVWDSSRQSGTSGKEAPAMPDPATGLLRHGDFLAAWSGEREKYSLFSLALLHLLPPVKERSGEDETSPGADLAARSDQLLSDAMGLFRNIFGSDIHAGRYGITSFMTFHPEKSPEELRSKYGELCQLLTNRLLPGRERSCAVGLAGYPYLDFRKADVLENCRKALEYGILLPAPHVGVFDSLAMTISADKRFSTGDILGAMTEYQQALLADEANALAWNSLGVTLARLSRHATARSHFERAIALDPDPNTFYNMGYACQCLNERDEARSCYNRCLEMAPDHLYAIVRLGQLAEIEEDRNKARSFYDQAGKIPGGRAVAFRYLAGLSLTEGKIEEARECLHDALSLDPQNAVALQMLAELYLDGGEDAEVAESLARQSVALWPERKAGWIALARALESRGRKREAREAVLHAGTL